jgi:hypothetical protein
VILLQPGPASGLQGLPEQPGVALRLDPDGRAAVPPCGRDPPSLLPGPRGSRAAAGRALPAGASAPPAPQGSIQRFLRFPHGSLRPARPASRLPGRRRPVLPGWHPSGWEGKPEAGPGQPGRPLPAGGASSRAVGNPLPGGWCARLPGHPIAALRPARAQRRPGGPAGVRPPPVRSPGAKRLKGAPSGRAPGRSGEPRPWLSGAGTGHKAGLPAPRRPAGGESRPTGVRWARPGRPAGRAAWPGRPARVTAGQAASLRAASAAFRFVSGRAAVRLLAPCFCYPSFPSITRISNNFPGAAHLL